MFDRFIAFLKNLPAPERPLRGGDDPRVAAAALLYHLMDADGVRGEGETAQLPLLLTETFGIGGAELEAVMAAGATAEGEAVDLYAFTSVVNRHLDHEAKTELVAAMWELVYADGELHELEDNIMWRIAELLNIESASRVALRRRARANAGLAG